MATDNLTAQRLRELVHYNQDTGVFTRIAGRLAGSVLGTKNGIHHLKASIDGKEYLLHRLAWLYMTGDWPIFEIDHKSGDGFDNRWPNLRDASHHINQQNRRRANKNSKSGFLGVTWKKDKRKWCARLLLNDRYAHLGYFDTAELAHAAYVEAKRIHHAGCTL